MRGKYYEYGNGTYGRVSYVFTGAGRQDFGTKQVSTELLWLSGTAALVCQSLSVLCLAFMKEAGAEEAVLPFFLNAWGPYLAGVLPGAALLVLSRLGCGIGVGDGVFFW